RIPSSSSTTRTRDERCVIQIILTNEKRCREGAEQARLLQIGQVCYLPLKVRVLPMPVTKSQPVLALKLPAVPLRMSRKFVLLIVNPFATASTLRGTRRLGRAGPGPRTTE